VANASGSPPNKPIIVAGPTGVGKTAFAVELATWLDGEIIGADAYQVYRGLEILTAQPGPALQARVPHHLVGFLSPSESFDAASYVLLAQAKIAEIQARGRVPILVGGAGLYLKALTHGLDDFPSPDPALREELGALSLSELQTRLDTLDPAARYALDFQNPRRLQRAIELCLLTGRPFSSLRALWTEKSTPGFRGLVLFRSRPELAARIRENVRQMFAFGVADEIRRLGPIGPTAAAAIGYREIRLLLQGKLTEPACIDAIVLATRRYAKRQLTWFRNQFSFQSIDLTGFPDIQPKLSEALAALAVI